MYLFVNTEKLLIVCLWCYFTLTFVFLKTFFHTNSVINELCLLSEAFSYIA